MDKEISTTQDHHPTPSPSLLLPNSIKEDLSPRKPFSSSATSGADRLKRDEWSEGAVSCLLEAYENKWVLRNRAKLKGHDWEDVARYVSARANSTKSPKTQTQCKNKIESMKKRYRSESATPDGSSWPLYSRLDLLLRGTAPPQPPPPPISSHPAQAAPAPALTSPPLVVLEPSAQVVVVSQSPALPPTPAPPPAPVVGNAQNSHGSNGFDRLAKEDGDGTKFSDHEPDKIAMETDSSTPALYSDKEKLRSKKLKMKLEKKKRRRKEEWEIAESIRWLAEVVVRSEQARMETMKEIEKMRAEAEAKRGEMDLKRTEIIASTQLEIAKIFAATSKGSVDSSLRIGRS
ncbi:trihelix transcription factor ASIL1 [Carica papaya]|uniref:trihelix transcription factor ASIL1 n=1 Tax=Carica papaya TaxID=3649 RepID=UPI000B8D0D91|nr:trihelix transcription factor ASIL1 [Carica papaya]